MTVPIVKKRLRKKNNRRFCIPFSIQPSHYPHGGCLSLKDFCKDLFKAETVNCLHIKDTSRFTPTIYINKKPIGKKKLIIRNDRALGFINNPNYIEIRCDDLGDDRHDYIDFRTSLNNVTLINPLEIYGFRDTKEALNTYIKMLNNRFIKDTDPFHMHPNALTRQGITHQVVKIIPTQVFCRNVNDFKNTKFVYYVERNKATPLEDVAAFFTGMFENTRLAYDFVEDLNLEIIAPLQQLKNLTIFDDGDKLTLNSEEEGAGSYYIFSPKTCTARLNANVMGWARWSIYESEGVRTVFYHPFGFVCG